MTTPFDPPTEPDHLGGVWVVSAWALAGACVGTSVGTTLHLTGTPGAASGLGMGGIAVGGLLGGLAYAWERRRSLARPALIDGRGLTSRPLHAALFAVPIAASIPALSWLVVVGSISIGSVLPAGIFLMCSIGLLWAARKVAGKHVLARSLELLESGQEEVAIRRLRKLTDSLWASRSDRTVARLNLGTVALAHGELDDAAAWFDAIDRGLARAHARVALALVCALRDELDAAEVHLAEALTGDGGRVIQAQGDAVRLLLVWRRDGPEDARQLGERLVGPGAGTLFLGLLASARRASGSPVELDVETRDALHASGFVELVPELRAIA